MRYFISILLVALVGLSFDSAQASQGSSDFNPSQEPRPSIRKTVPLLDWSRFRCCRARQDLLLRHSDVSGQHSSKWQPPEISPLTWKNDLDHVLVPAWLKHPDAPYTVYLSMIWENLSPHKRKEFRYSGSTRFKARVAARVARLKMQRRIHHKRTYPRLPIFEVRTPHFRDGPLTPLILGVSPSPSEHSPEGYSVLSPSKQLSPSSSPSASLIILSQAPKEWRSRSH